MVERDQYMQEGFDPNSLTMPQLRNILVEHEIPFSSIARKADLVSLFNQRVLPRTASLRSQNSSITASSSGIIDMRDEITPEQTPAKRRPGRPRKSEAATPAPASATPSTARTPRKSAAASSTRTPARKKSSLANQLATSTESEAEPEVEQIEVPIKRKPGRPRKSVSVAVAGSKADLDVESEADAAKPEADEVEAPVKRKPGRPRKSAPAVVAAPVEASEPEDHASPRRVSFGPTASPPASTSRKAGRLSSGGKSDDDGTFSDTNPFQSGSEASPASGAAAKAAASAKKARRKTTDGTSTVHKKSSNQSLSAADSPARSAQQSSPGVTGILRNYMDQGVAAITPPRIVSRITGTTSADSTDGHAGDDEGAAKHGKDATADAGTEADEEDFDVDTFMSPSALAKMRTLRRKKDKQRRRDQRAGKSLSEHLVSSIYSLVFIGLLAWIAWYARQTRALGFCDTNSNTNAIVEDRRLTALAYAEANNETVEDLAILPARLQPTCTPCPAHAECAHGKVLGCSSDDWVLQPSLRSHIPLANFFLPLSQTAPRCYPDTQKLVLASELAQAISHMLADFKGEIVCGTQKTHATVRSLPRKVLGSEGNLTYAIAETAVKRSMSATRDARVDEDYFEQIWYMALFELTDPRSNIVRVPVTNGTIAEGQGTQYFLAAKQPSLSLSCRSRLALKGWVLRARLYFFLVLSAVSGFFYLRYRLAAARAESTKVALLVQAALDKLQEQEYLHGLDPVLHPDDFVPLSHLRDHLLADVHQSKTRNRLWRKVAKVVEENSNVRTRQAQKKGEYLRVWQWVGVESWKAYDGTPSRTGEVAEGQGSVLPVA